MGNIVARRATVGAAVRGILSALQAAGVHGEICQRVSPEAKGLFDTPPLYAEWIDNRLVDELLLGAEALRGRDFVRSVGYEATRGSAGPVLLPILKAFLNISGSTPSTVFSNLYHVVPMEVRGVTPHYERTDDRSGIVTLTFCERVPPCEVAVWEGVLHFAFDVCGTPGEVVPAELSPDGMSARVAVKW